MSKESNVIRNKGDFLSGGMCQEWQKQLLVQLEGGLGNSNICVEIIWSKESPEVGVEFWTYTDNGEVLFVGNINLKKGLVWKTEFNLLISKHTQRMEQLTKELSNEIRIIRALTVPTGL